MAKVYRMTFKHDKYPYNMLTIGYGTEWGIIDVDGFDGENIDVELDEYTFNGAKVKKVRATSRDLSIHFENLTQHSFEKYDEILRFFTPFQTGRLTVTNEDTTRAIDYIVSLIDDKRDNLYHNVEFELQMKCPGAFFKSPEYVVEDLATWAGGFSLPLCPEDYDRAVHEWNEDTDTLDVTGTPNPNVDSPGFKLRHRENAEHHIYCDAHVDTPVWIEFHGPAKSPMVQIVHQDGTKVNIQVAKELTEQEYLTIKTWENNPEITITDGDGNTTNGYPYLTQESDLEFYLQPGDNKINYFTADSSMINEVILRYKPFYMGV